MSLVLAFLGLILCGSGFAQGDPYQAVPGTERQEFVASAERCIALTKAGNWKELYAILDQTRVTVSEEQFIRKRKGLHRLVEFSIRKVVFIPPADAWQVIGCALYNPHVKGIKDRVRASFMMRRTEQGWRTETIGIEMDSEDPTGIGRCRPGVRVE